MAEEGFHDYTLATRVERLVAQLEQCFRGWLLTGLENISHLPPALGADKQPINLVRVSSNITHRMPWRSQPYILTLHVPYTREADLQAARNRQQQQQQAQQKQQQQQARAAAAARPDVAKAGHRAPQPPQPPPPPAAAAAAASAAPAGDRTAAAAAASEVLARHVAAAAAAGGQGPEAMQQLHAELAPLLSTTGIDGSSQQQLQQQVDDLVEQYRQLHLQLQEDAAQQQQQEEEAGERDGTGPQAAAADEGGAITRSSQRRAGSAKAAGVLAAAAQDASAALGLSGPGASNDINSSSGTSASNASSSVGQAAASSSSTAVAPAETHERGRGTAAAAARTGAKKLQASKLQAVKGAEAAAATSRAGSSVGAAAAELQPGDSAAAATTAAAAAVQEDAGVEEATSRQVELPAPEQLADANSRALAAVKAAVQLDHSSTAASRSWWPSCYDADSIVRQLQYSSSILAATQQQQQQQHLQQPQHQQPLQLLQPQLLQLHLLEPQLLPPQLLQLQFSGIPKIGLPWWSPSASSNKLQRWFGLDLFVLLQPASYSRRFLDAAESSSLLSVARLALSSCGVCWPLLLPLHDAVRDAYVGVAQVGGLSVLLHTDSIHISRLPKHLSAPEEQLRLFAGQLIPHNPAAAAACLAVLGELGGNSGLAAAIAAAGAASAAHSSNSGRAKDRAGRGNTSSWLAPGPFAASVTQQQQQQQQQGEHVEAAAAEAGVQQYAVWLSACFTYRLPDASKRFHLQQRLCSSSSQHPSGPQQQQQQQQQWPQQLPELPRVSHDDEELEFLDWDADSAWHPWAQYRDPVAALELDVVWQDTQLTAAPGDGTSRDGHNAAAAAAGGGKVPSVRRPESSSGNGSSGSSGGREGREGGVGGILAAARPPMSPAAAAVLLSDAAAADVWVLHVLHHGYSSAPARAGRLGVQGFERHRRHVRVEAAGADWLWTAAAANAVLTQGGRMSGVCPQPWGSSSLQSPAGAKFDLGALSTMLSALLTARTAAAAAESLWDLASAEWWEAHGEAAAPPLPPDSVLDTVLRDLLSPPRPSAAAAGAVGGGGHGSSGSAMLSRRDSRDSAGPSSAGLSSLPISRSGSGALPAGAAGPGWQQAGAAAPAAAASSASAPCTGTAGAAGDMGLPRSAPTGSLLCRLALHALVFGNARAVAVLWQRFVMQARLQFWEQRTLLPHLPAGQHSSSSSNSRRSTSSRNSLSLPAGAATPAAAVTSAFAAAAAAAAAGGSTSHAGIGAAAGAVGGPPAPDLDSCLIHQKLQMLNICTWRRDRRLARGQSTKLQQQQQQQRLPNRLAGSSSSLLGSSSSINGGGSSSGSLAADAGSNSSTSTGAAAAAAAAGGGSSSRLSGLGTAGSSTFFSVAGDEGNDDDTVGTQEQEQGLSSSAAADEAAAAATSRTKPGSSSQQQQQRQQQQEQFEDANSEFYSLTGSGAATATADAVSDPEAEPQGVAAVVPGQYLLLWPDRPLRVPVVQDTPVFTEDQMIQQQTALLQLAAAAAADEGNSSSSKGNKGLPTDSSAASAAELLLLRQRLLAAPVLSDMCAFKAANPGCCFGDFLRWYSPKDWQQQQQEAEQQTAEQQEGSFDLGAVRVGNAPGALNNSSSSGGSSQASSSTPARAASQEPSAALVAQGAAAKGPAAAAAEAPEAAAVAAGPAASYGGQVSARMGTCPNNEWQQLWLLAQPQPAAAQRPLLNPQKEGELVLHYLETLSPPALFSQLLAAAVTEALSLLGSSKGAALPAAAAVVDRFHSMAASVLRKGGGLSEALQAAAAAAAAVGPPGRAQQQQQVQQADAALAGDWQGAEEGLSDVELELLLAEFSYVEQVVVLAESLLHHLPGQQELAARLLQHLLHGCDSTAAHTSLQQQQHVQRAGEGTAAPESPGAAAAAAAESAVLGPGCRLPVACLTPQERHALLQWVSACRPADTVAKLQRNLSRRLSAEHAHEQHHHQQQHQQQQPHWEETAVGSSSTSAARHLQDLSSPRAVPDHHGIETASTPTRAAFASQQQGPQGSQQSSLQTVEQLAASPVAAAVAAEQLLQELRGLQDALGQPAQREWVTTCGPMPDLSPGGSCYSSSSGVGTSGSMQQQQQQQTAGLRLKPGVAAAVASAAAGGGGGSYSRRSSHAGQQSGVAVGNCPVPPSRLYVQQADGEMRLALLLVSQQGL